MPGYELKLNSYDLGVDIELYDATQRLRFEHPEVRAVVLTSAQGQDLLRRARTSGCWPQSSHPWKVNFCKFTNETRNGIEDATANSGQTYLAAVNGTAAGGGYELALACEQILLVDDNSSTVALPEVPLLGVLPGTGGLTRVIDKRGVRKDRADVFATQVRGRPAAAGRRLEARRRGRPASELGRDGARAGRRGRRRGSHRPTGASGIALPPAAARGSPTTASTTATSTADVRPRRRAWSTITVLGPEGDVPDDRRAGPRARRRLLAARHDPRARRPDPAAARQRARARHLADPDRGRRRGRAGVRAGHRRALAATTGSSTRSATTSSARSSASTSPAAPDRADRAGLAASPARCWSWRWPATGSTCSTGTFEDARRGAASPAQIVLTDVQLRRVPDGQRPDPAAVPLLRRRRRRSPSCARRPARASTGARPRSWAWSPTPPTTSTGRTRSASSLEERASLSPDALTGMEANHRFVGPETMETQDLRPAHRLAELDLHPPQRVGPGGRAAPLRHGPQGRLRPEAGVSDEPVDRLRREDPEQRRPGRRPRLQRALEALAAELPQLVGRRWARPLPTQDVYLRTAVDVGREGWAHFDHVADAGVPLGHLPRRARPDRHDRVRRAQGRAGLAAGARRVPRRPAAPDRHPGRHRAGVGRAAAPPRARPRRRSTTCATCSRSTSRRAVTSGRWSTCCTPTSAARAARRPRRCCCATPAATTRPRILGAFNEETPDWLSFFMFTYFTDRDGKYQLGTLKESRVRPAVAHVRVHAQGGGAPHVRRHHRRRPRGGSAPPS